MKVHRLVRKRKYENTKPHAISVASVTITINRLYWRQTSSGWRLTPLGNTHRFCNL